MSETYEQIYELEIRAKIQDKKEMEAVIAKLKEMGEETEQKTYHTILFRNNELNPPFIRLRHKK
jgi:adenylate cyclase class IV